MRLLPRSVTIAGGAIELEGQDLAALSEAEMRSWRGRRLGMIFQEPMTALNPLMRVGAQIEEVVQAHTDLSAKARGERVLALMRAVSLPTPELLKDAYPFRLSGGQRQRVMIAMALALDPALLIADEPTTALDVTTQKQILALIKEIQRRRRMGVLFITHDFGVVAEIADRVAVMQHGIVVEIGKTEDVLNAPASSLYAEADRRGAEADAAQGRACFGHAADDGAPSGQDVQDAAAACSPASGSSTRSSRST